jgi:lysophospholipase L1-like esterase
MGSYEAGPCFVNARELTPATVVGYHAGVRALRWVLLLAVGLGAVLLAVEMALRAGGAGAQLGYSDVPLGMVVPDRTLGYALPPSERVSFGGVETHLDANGLRNPPAPPDAQVSVLVLGDERTFGWGVADGEGFPAQLEVWIRSRCPTCGRVMNAGVPGYTTYQGVLQARDLGNRFRPKTVVAAFGLNDALLDGAETGVTALPPPLVRTSALAGRLYEWWHRPGTGWWDATPRTPVPRYSRNLRALVSEVRRFGGLPVLLNIGYGADLPDPGAAAGKRLRRGRIEDDYHGATRLVSELEDAPLVDVIGARLDATTMLDAIHPSAEGHRRIAAALGERLAAEGLVTP